MPMQRTFPATYRARGDSDVKLSNNAARSPALQEKKNRKKKDPNAVANFISRVNTAFMPRYSVHAAEEQQNAAN